MARQQRFLTESYGAYHQARLPPFDETLARVGPGTPGGEYLRRFWHPVAQSAMLGDLPVAIRRLGEDLVIYRDQSGEIGLLERHCSHRGTSLEFGRIEETGIRCCYHGWLFGNDGAILEAPAEPDDNPYVGKRYHGAYPTIDYRGLVFAYMGPPAKKPPFRRFETFEDPSLRFGLGEPVGGNVKPCNWLQIMDNVADPVHEAYLHASISGIQFFDAHGEPLVELADRGVDDYWLTDHGVTCHVARRVKDSVWVRSMEYVAPNIIQLRRTPVLPPTYPAGGDVLGTAPLVTRWRVPVDDGATVEYSFVYYADGEGDDYLDRPSDALATNYGGRDYEQRQRYPGDWDAQVGQRPIAVHATEHLATTDRGVALARRMVREGIDAVGRGEDPVGVVRDPEAVVPIYANELVRHAPAAATAEADKDLIRDVSRAAYEDVLAGRRPRLTASSDN